MSDSAPTFGLWYDFRQRKPFAQPYGEFYAECMEEIEEAERLGYAGIWLSEHHFVDDGYLPSPLVAAAAVAARTARVTIGTNVLLLPIHHPLRVAEDAAVVDLLSGGRFVLGVGLGYVLHEFEALGFDRKYRPSLLEEGVEVIRRAWKEGRIGYSGKRWRFDDLPFEPRPEREIPVYFGGYSEPALDRAARMADGFLASSGRADLEETHRILRDRLVARGRNVDEFPFICSATVYVDEDPDLAWETVAPGIAYQRNRYAEWGTDPGKPVPPAIRPEDLDRGRFFVGTPEDIAGRLARLHREAPYDHLCFWGRLPGVTHEQALSSMRLFAEEVAPRVRSATGAK